MWRISLNNHKTNIKIIIKMLIKMIVIIIKTIVIIRIRIDWTLL
jgi:hypothetical protein